MHMGFRWYGEGNDAIKLSDIKQIPGVTSIVWALHHKMPGEIWTEEEIKDVMDQLHAYGFNGDVVESVNVHDDIKIRKPTRDALIENYKQCIRNVKHFDNGDFSEASHRDCDGETQIVNIIKAYHEAGYEGYIRPDHGRHLWNEGPGTVRPCYGLYDRALGIMYMLGVWDTLDKLAGKVTVANSN